MRETQPVVVVVVPRERILDVKVKMAWRQEALARAINFKRLRRVHCWPASLMVADVTGPLHTNKHTGRPSQLGLSSSLGLTCLPQPVGLSTGNKHGLAMQLAGQPPRRPTC